MTTCAPSRSLEQRLTALATANRVRGYRRIIRVSWQQAGKHEACALFTLAIGSPPAELETMAVRDLLLMIPKIGPRAADRALTGAGVGYATTIGGLTNRQRVALATWADMVQRGPWVCPECGGAKGSHGSDRCRACHLNRVKGDQ